MLSAKPVTAALAALCLTLTAACADDSNPVPPPPATQQQVQEPAAQDPPPAAQPQAAQHEQPDQQSDEQPQPAPQEQPTAQQEDAPAPPPALSGPADAPHEPAFDPAAARAYLEHLAGVLGPRSSGTAEERAAADYLANTFTALGYDVEIHQFRFANDYSFARVDFTDDIAPYVYHFPQSARHSVTAELVLVNGYGALEDYEGVDVEGKIAMVERGEIFFHEKAANAEAAGAAALIIFSTNPEATFGGTLGDHASAIPVVMLVPPFQERHPYGFAGETIRITARLPENGESQNVIARLPDSECRVIVGGHYDTVPAVAGANDNASGAALVLALAELWAHHPAARDVCFLQFGAEELGLHGSNIYVDRLQERGELARVTAMINLDAIGNRSAPLVGVVTAPLVRTVQLAAAALGLSLDIRGAPRDWDSDHEAFSRAGVPIVFILPSNGIIHIPIDRLDLINWDVYEDIGRLNHHILACLLHRAGSPITPSITCDDS